MNKQSAKTITIDASIWEFMEEQADKNCRSLNKEIKFLLIKHIKAVKAGK